MGSDKRLLGAWLIFTAVWLLSCGNEAPQEKAFEGRKDEVKETEKGSITHANEEVAAAPKVIRSSVPPGYYRYTADTTQVSQYIRQIFQDKKGDLWFGTVGDGVCRYDGETLKYFTPKEGFAGNSVQKIVEDKQGRLWFATELGISKYDGKNFTNYTKKNGLISEHIFTLMEDHDGNLWVGTGAGVCVSKKLSSSDTTVLFESFLFPGNSQKPEVRSIMQAQDGSIWFGTTGQGIFKYSGGTFTQLSEKDGLSHRIVHCMVQDHTNGIWCATDGGGISRYDPAAEFTPGATLFNKYKDEKGDNRVTTLYKDLSGNIWSSVRGSVRCYDIRMNNRALPSFRAFSGSDGLNNCCVQSILQDRAGNFWFGSGLGISRIDKSRLDHPCVKKTCGHDLGLQPALRAHAAEVAKTVINVTKKGPWPKRFRS